MARAQLWTKDFIVGICLNLTMSMVFYLLMTSMAGYAIARFSAGQAAAGFASSSFIVGAVVARVLTGKYLDFIGRRKLLVISMVVFVLASLAYIAADTLALLIVIPPHPRRRLRGGEHRDHDGDPVGHPVLSPR